MADTYAATVQEARAAAHDLVRVERERAHAVVTLNDPANLNPLSAALTVRLREVLTELAADESLRAIVLTGADPAFSAGGDLRLMRDAAEPMLDSGGGAPELWRWIRMEFGPEVGTSWLLTRRLGYQRTFELFAAGRELSGAEAAELGLANAVVEHDLLVAEARDSCARLEALPAHVTAMMKPLLRGAADMTWDQAIAMEEFAEPQCFTTEAHRAAVSELLGPR